MAVVSVKLKSETTSEVRGKPTHRLVFLVRCNIHTDTSDMAIVATDGVTSIPASMSAHPSGDGTICLRKDSQKIDKSIAEFEVTCEYEIDEKTSSGGGGGGGDLTDPLLRPAEYSFEPAESTENYMIDESPPQVPGGTGKPVVNKAFEPFDQMPVRDTSETIITVRRNEATHNPTLETHSRVVVNSEDVVIDGKSYAAGTLKLSPPAAQKMTEVVGGVPVTYYQKTYKLKYRPQGWTEKIENRGYSYVSGDKRYPIVDEAGEPVTKPWPLDSFGGKLPNASSNPTILDFEPYKKVSFAALIF